MVTKEGNRILHIRISHEEKHELDDEISLSSDENSRSRPPLQCDVDILASNHLKASGVSWEASAESLLVIQVSVITYREQLV